VETQLVPAHVHFTKWFIRIRWLAISILVVATLVVRYILDISIHELSILIIAGILLALNVLHRTILQRIRKESDGNTVQKIKREIHFQIITDLILLTLILHYSGGVENPLVLFYFFHLIIASSIFSTLQSYIYALFTLILAASLALLECYGIIPHYPLEGFNDHGLYQSPMYVYGSGFVFACTSVLLVFLSHMIISRSIKSEETYIRTNTELENKDKLKNEYVLRVTHDIKGHVAAILSCIEVMRSKSTGPLTPLQEEFVNRAYDRTELLSGFVKNLLNLTRKRLQHDNETEEFSLKELINKVVASVRILAADKSIDFNVYVDKSVNMFTGNPYTIEELYSNLLLNAVKYTPSHGHIEMSVRNRIGHILTEISDSGIGIPEDELSKVFDEFYRASNVPKDIKHGSGLGLSIAKEIVERHNGKIWVSSEPGVWTKFSFTLPKDLAAGA
jgi:signal transduction histidine kinase